MFLFLNEFVCFFWVSVLLLGCSDIVYEENIHCNEIEKPWETDFCQDTISFGKLASDCCRYIFRLDESSASITDNTKYTFHIPVIRHLFVVGSRFSAAKL
mgnify:CR=1 FL=1